MKDLYILNVDDSDVGNLVIEVFSARQLAVQYLAKWCRACWQEQGHDEDDKSYSPKPLPKKDLAAIKHYFDFWNPTQAYLIWKTEIDPSKLK